MKNFKFKINGQQYEVEINEFEGQNAKVLVNGTEYDVEVEAEVARPKTPTLVRRAVVTKPGEGQIKKAEGGAAFKVKAPLPGNIFKLNVSVGDTVAEGDCLLIMEAMKMENNVLSEKGGTVKAIKVNVGDAVLQDDVLIELG